MFLIPEYFHVDAFKVCSSFQLNLIIFIVLAIIFVTEEERRVALNVSISFVVKLVKFVAL